MGSSPDINYPQQPSYGEGMADAMKAQMEQLLGQGEYAQMYADAGFAGGNLGDIIAGVEAPIRQKTAQVDTDVLRQTLLGNEKKFQVEKDPDTGKYGITGAEVVKGEDGEPQTAGDGRYQMVQIADGKNPVKSTSVLGGMQGSTPGVTAKYAIIDTTTGGISSTVGGEYFLNPGDNATLYWKNTVGAEIKTLSGDKNTASLAQVSKEFTRLRDAVGESGADAAAKEFQFENPYTGEPLEEGQTVTIREGDGMIDLLGDKRKALGDVPDYAQYVKNQPDLYDAFVKERQSGGTSARSIEEYGKDHYETYGRDEGREMPTSFSETNRQAGFDAEGNFLGLSALAEDIQRGNLSRQREADLADVERLSDRFQTVMEDYKPGTTSGLDDARLLLEQQRENLTGLREATQADVDAGTATAIGEMIQTGRGGPVTIPTGSTYGGDITASTMNAAQVADPLALSAKTQFGGELATGQTATGEATLRSALLGDAKTALGQGLTDRETRSIQDAARARSTMMGRTFDQSGAIAEAEARVQEDNARRMQNRSFAQSVLGQEAGIQQGDITRGMAQESEQAGLQQRTDLAQAQMDQQANAFDADAAMRAATINQGQQQQAAQFGVGAQMDAERLNEQLRQQGLGNYINAVGNLAQIEDSYTLDPFQALLGRGGGGSLQAGQGVFGQAGYGLQSGPQYLNPEAGLGYISQMAANDANMYAANVSANASRNAGLMGGLGALGGGLAQGVGAAGSVGAFFCWVAREVYGPANPAWLQFREWMFTESPNWFFKLYAEYGERFANWISDKPRIKSIIRKWMDSKIGGK